MDKLLHCLLVAIWEFPKIGGTLNSRTSRILIIRTKIRHPKFSETPIG